MFSCGAEKSWMPAFAGMTLREPAETDPAHLEAALSPDQLTLQIWYHTP
jgi:hypothetical protein